MKKIVAIIISHLLVLCSVIGVIGALTTTQASEGYDKFTGVLENNVTIRILENDTAIKQGYLKELLGAFNAKYSEYGIVAVDANMDEYSNLEQDGPHGYGPDILYQANDRLMKYVYGKHIQPLPIEQLDCYEVVGERAWGAFRSTVDGVDYTCGVPVNVQAPLLYYRKDLLPTDWKTSWDKNSNDVPDMVENWNDMYRYSLTRRQGDSSFGYMKSLFDPYFSVGYLYSYGAYSFGNNNTDPTDIGYSNGNAAIGASVIRQLAGIMNEWCIDDTITRNSYTKLADGSYFATMTTPDVYTMFLDEMVRSGMTMAQATDNLVVTHVPQLPASGNLTEIDPVLIDTKLMGGVNGYAVSSYTKYPNACLAFIDFATSFEMIHRRNVLLGISPARADVAEQVGGLSEVISNTLEAGNIVIMPSIKENGQMWTPLQTFFTDLATDAFRFQNNQVEKYLTLEQMKVGLQKVDQQIYEAIFTLG